MDWLLTAVGVGLIVLAVRDIFHTLWHPRGLGSLTRGVFALTWKLAHLVRARRALTVAGPLALMFTATSWALTLALGFTLVYLPQMPQAFVHSSGLRPAESSDLMSAAYLSLVAMATLGLGDIVPQDDSWLRLVVPLEALLGFILLTAVITWVLQLYPALVRRRALARGLSTMAATGTPELVADAETDASVAVQLLEGVRLPLAASEMDLAQYAESYYFHEPEEDLSLAVQLSHAVALAEAADRSPSPEVRHAGQMLSHGTSRFTALLAEEFYGESDREQLEVEQVLTRYAEDHGHDLAERSQPHRWS